MDFLKKIPKQERSKALVDSVLEATGMVLDQFGLNDTTTEKISNKTGVSVGSLYQYFRNKNMMISGFINHQMKKHQKIFLDQIVNLSEREPEIFLEEFTRFVYAYMKENYRKTLYIYRYASQFQQHSELMRLRQEIIDSIAIYIQSRSDLLRPGVNPKVSATILVHGVMGVFEKTMESEESEKCLNELIHMMKLYMLRPAKGLDS